jgi:hypothetical protein
MTTREKDHPEREPDEVYLGNFSETDAWQDDDGRSSWEIVGWISKRKGNIARNIHGVAYCDDGEMFPGFVKIDEIRRSKHGEEILALLLPSPVAV